MSCQMMLSLGVYVLGAADAGERARVETHLPGCPACQAELARLAPLPGLLAGVPGEMRRAGLLPGAGAVRPAWHGATGQPIRPGANGQLTAAGANGQLTPAGARRQRAPASTGGRLRGRADGQRGTVGGSGQRWRAAAASGTAAAYVAAAACVAACVAVAAGVVSGFWPAPAGPAARPAARPATVTLSGANLATHMSATAALTDTSWGTSIRLRLRGLPLNVPCRLIVRSRTGATEVAGVWDAWRDGPITVPASAGWRTSGIASLEVATAARTLVTIVVRHGRHPRAPLSEEHHAPFPSSDK